MSSTNIANELDSQQDIFELGSPSSFHHPPAKSHWFGLSNQNGDASSRSESGHEYNVLIENDMVELSRGGPDFGSLSPFGQDLPEKLTITTVNPNETILGFNYDHTFCSIMLGNEVPPQLPASSVPPMLGPFPFENAAPSPTVRGIGSGRMDPVRTFACAGKCGNSGCTSTFASKSNLARHCRPADKRHKACEYCRSIILCQNMARHKRICVAR